MVGKSNKGRINSNFKTKKRRKNRSRTKYRGGKATSKNTEADAADATDATKTEPSGLRTPEQIMQKIKDDRENKKKEDEEKTKKDDEEKKKEDGLVNDSVGLTENIGTRVFNDSVNLTEGVTLNAVENTSKLMGVDLTNTEETKEKLDEIKTTINDPETQKKMQEVIGEAAKVGAVAVEAAKPFLDPLIDTMNEKSNEILSKAGETGVKVLLNTAEEIPGVGVVIGSVRSISNIGDAVVSAVNASSEVVTATSDTVNATTQNFEQIMKEKNNIENRTQDSISKHDDPLKYPVPETSKVPKRGGTKKHNYKNKYNMKSKRVRFNL